MNKQDWKDYESYLLSQISSTKRQKETLFTNHYIDNLYKDLKDVKKNVLN